MEINDYTENVAEAMRGLGISKPSLGNTTMDDIVGRDIDLDEISLEELEQYLLEISAYNIFLKSQKGSYDAKLKILNAEYKRLLGLETHAGPQASQNGGWLTKEEKEAYAIEKRHDLRAYREEIIALDAKLTKIKDLPYAIDKQLDILTIKLRRRIKLEEAGRYERSRN